MAGTVEFRAGGSVVGCVGRSGAAGSGGGGVGGTGHGVGGGSVGGTLARVRAPVCAAAACIGWRSGLSVLGRSGSDLLSRVLRRSTIGARGFHGRVRDGIGCLPPAITTRSSKHALIPVRDPERHDLFGLQRLSLFREVFVLPVPARRHLACAGRCRCVWWADQADRAISTSQLNVLPRLHPWPIDVMVYHGSQARPGFEGGFPLRCFQRLSRPYIATLRCRWRDNRYTRGTSIPVLSY